MRERLRKGVSDAGVTLFEMLVSMAIFGVVIAMTMTVLTEVQGQTKENLIRADSVGHARVGLSFVDRSLRSAEFLSVSSDGMTITAYSGVTQSGECSQFRVFTGAVAELRQRQWTPGQQAGSWHTLAAFVANTSAQPAFTLSGASSQTAAVKLYIKSPESNGAPVLLETSYTRRNSVGDVAEAATANSCVTAGTIG